MNTANKLPQIEGKDFMLFTPCILKGCEYLCYLQLKTCEACEACEPCEMMNVCM